MREDPIFAVAEQYKKAVQRQARKQLMAVVKQWGIDREIPTTELLFRMRTLHLEDIEVVETEDRGKDDEQ